TARESPPTGLRMPFCTTPGRNGCGKVAVGAGSGAFSPSLPMRNTLLRSTEPEAKHAPVMETRLHVTYCSRTGPDMGTSRLLTPFNRPNSRPYPPRNTVLPSPNTLRRNPDLNCGFQATDIFGLTPPWKGS